jgi:F1F0 ATPase subunit 2
MTEFLTLTFAFFTGATLAFIFYGGLWLTVRKVIALKRQPLWLPVSLFVRIFITFAGFCIVSGTNKMSFAACIAGFVLARLVVLKLVFAWKQRNTFLDQEVTKNAPQS